MGTVLVITILGLVGYIGYVLFQTFESWTLASGQDALASLDAEAQELLDLAREKSTVMQSIKDLEFDFETGHMSEEDYQSMRSKLERKAITILKRLDELRGDVDYDAIIDHEYALRFGDPDEDYEDEAHEAQEAAPAPPQKAPAKVAKKPAAPASADELPCGSCGHGVAPGAKFCSHCGAEQKKTKFCTECGTSILPNAKFCASCGTQVKAPNTTSPGEASA